MNPRKWMRITSVVAVLALVVIMLVPTAFAQAPVDGVTPSFGQGMGQMSGMMERQGGRMGMQGDTFAAGPMSGRGRGQGQGGQGQGTGFVDNNGDGVCDNMGQGGRGGQGTGFVDNNGDGVCDNCQQ